MKESSARSELLRLYCSECLSHAGYLLTLGLISVGWLELLFRVVDLLWKALVLSAIIPVVVAGIYLVLRTLWWGALANAIVSMPHQWSEDLVSLHNECANYVCGRESWKQRREQRVWNEILGSKVCGGQLKWFVFFGLMVWIIGFMYIFLLI